MPRPGFVLTADDKTPPILTIGGTKLALQRFASGTRVAYPAEAEPSSDPRPLLTAALNAPLSGPPLEEQLRAARRLTIVFGDGTTPRPAMKFDVRRDIVERVLELAARVGIDDVELIAATGLRPRMSEDEAVRTLGGRVVQSFITDDLLRSHDAVDEAGLRTIGEVDGHVVRINRRVAECDLVINVVVRDGDVGCPLEQLVCGLTDVATIDYVSGLEGRRDPSRAHRVAELISGQVPVTTIEAVLGAPSYDPPLAFVHKREWEWRLTDQLAWVGLRQALARAPKQAAARLFGSLRADYAVHDIVVGDPRAADEQARQVWRTINAVALPEDTDVLATSVWGIGHGSSDPIGSPLAAAHRAAVTGARVLTARPAVRRGGVLIAYHPLTNRFSNRHHTSAADFFADVLPRTRDADEIRALYQDRYVADPWYLELYRTRHAYHPLYVFHQWYATAAAMAYLGDIIWVGGDRTSAAVLGQRAATTYADALEIAANRVGRQPNVLVLR